MRVADVMFSHQVSLPSMIYEHDCDTRLPTNIFDDEFHPDIKELPPPRPSTDATPISYMIAKSRLCNELGNILQTINRVGRSVSYDEIIRFDAKLRQIMQELPPHLQFTSLEGSQEPVAVIFAKFNVDILYQKVLCLLHRKYLPKARQNPRYAHSRRSAIEASLRAMDHLAALHRESQPDGRLRSASWYVKTIATKEFTLPAMLIILDLHFDNISAQSVAQQDCEGTFLWSPEQRAHMISALETAGSIWKSLADFSMEAYKAYKIIEIMLQKIKEPEENDLASNGSRLGPLSAFSADVGMEESPNMAQDPFSPSRLAEFSSDMNPFANSNSSAFMGLDFGLPPTTGIDIEAEGLNNIGVASPLSMFTTVGGGGGSGAPGDLTANFDWVSDTSCLTPVA